jgi:transposase
LDDGGVPHLSCAGDAVGLDGLHGRIMRRDVHRGGLRMHHGIKANGPRDGEGVGPGAAIGEGDLVGDLLIEPPRHRAAPRAGWPLVGEQGVTDACHPGHRHSEFLAFLKLVAKAYPRRQLHVVVDNYATHKHQRVQAWLQAHPRVQLHFTPTYASWLNLVEVFFAIIERQALRRGDFASVQELITAIARFCESWNQRCQPFRWTKDADQILGKLNRQPPQQRTTHVRRSGWPGL